MFPKNMWYHSQNPNSRPTTSCSNFKLIEILKVITIF
jgi:hypothetical protein